MHESSHQRTVAVPSAMVACNRLCANVKRAVPARRIMNAADKILSLSKKATEEGAGGKVKCDWME